MKQNNKPIPRSRMERLMAENIMRNTMIKMTGLHYAMIDRHGVMKLMDDKELSIVDGSDGDLRIAIIVDGRKSGYVPINYDDPDATVDLLTQII